MTAVLHKLFIIISCVMLFSCTGSNVMQGGDSALLGSNLSYIDVDSDVESDFNSAVVLIQQEKYSQAIDVLKSVIEREQRLPAPYVNLAIAYNRSGNSKEAEANLISALKLDIGDPVANNELGLLYRKAGKFKAAHTAYSNAIRQHPDYLPAKRNLGVLCDLYMHDYQCALEQYEAYLEQKPDDSTVAIWIADVKSRLDK
ncbi:MAG: tetratricopeptide repeat protein [Gammaproteobacteria bacterium]|jgi:Flp pilus assembly protein TadD|nr:tetratricopeptide repeat protein [Gammaproteobacteria bacterium]